MSKFVELEPGVFVAGQIEAADLEAVHRLGIRTVVDNRPDEEVDAPVSSAMIAQAAIARGMSFLYRPVWGFELGEPGHEEAARQWLSQAKEPVLLYCRSGRRSTILWAQAAVDRLGIDAVLAAAARAGVQAEEILLVLEERLDRVAA